MGKKNVHPSSQWASFLTNLCQDTQDIFVYLFILLCCVSLDKSHTIWELNLQEYPFREVFVHYNLKQKKKSLLGKMSNSLL